MRQIFAEKLQSIKGPVADNWFFILLVLFIIGFFITPERSFHRNGYYLLLFLPAAIVFLQDSSLRNILKETLFLLILIFIIYASLSIIWAENKTLGLTYDIIRYALLVFSFPIVIVLAFRKNKWRVDNLLLWSVLGSSMIALFTLIVFYLYLDNTFPYTRVEGLSPYISKATQCGILYGFFATVGLCFLSQKNKRLQLSFNLQLLTFFSVFILCTYVVLSQTRGAMLAFILSSFFLLFVKKKWKEIIIILVIATSTVTIIELSESIRGLLERGLGTRPYIWLESLRLFAEKPLFGYGTNATFLIEVSNDKHYQGPHNIILKLCLEYGLIGLSLWFFMTFYAFYQSIYIGIRLNDWTLTAMLFFTLIAWMFEERSLLSSPNSAWVLYWLPLGLILTTNIITRKSQKDTNKIKR